MPYIASTAIDGNHCDRYFSISSLIRQIVANYDEFTKFWSIRCILCIAGALIGPSRDHLWWLMAANDGMQSELTANALIIDNRLANGRRDSNSLPDVNKNFCFPRKCRKTD